MEDFYVGQRVQFKEWDEMVEEFDTDLGGDIHNGFMKSMSDLCGTTAVIKKTYKYDYDYKEQEIDLKDFSCKGNEHWTFSTNMIKPYKEMINNE